MPLERAPPKRLDDLHRSGRPHPMEQVYRQALKADPDQPEAHVNLAILCGLRGRGDLALLGFLRAVGLAPALTDAWANLGTALMGQGQAGAACRAFDHALRCRPQDATGWFNLGVALVEQGALLAAMTAFATSLACRPDFVKARYRLGLTRRDLGDSAGAVRDLRQAQSLLPDDADIANNLGGLLWQQSRLAESIRCFRLCLCLRPDFALAQNNLGNALADQGDTEAAIAAYRLAQRQDPGFAEAAVNLAFIHSYRDGVGPGDIARLAGQWYAAHAAPRSALSPGPLRIRLPRRTAPRIGLLSADFRAHPVGFLAAPVVEALARAGHPLTCYDNGGPPDAVTRRFRAAAADWRAVAGLSDDALAARIADDGIDILIDLSGHSAGNRLLLLARKPAPLQVTWLGWPATTGLPALDYILTDPQQVPPSLESCYAEKILRLPQCWAPYEPPKDDPEPGAPPCLSDGRVTFGSFNAIRKITPTAIASWSRILQRVPGSRLLLKAAALHCPATRQRLAGLFLAHGIDSDRLQLLGPTSLSEHRAAMRQVDIALDSFPFGGGITTLDSLWSGLPVITLPGETFGSRSTSGFLSAIGLTGLAASTPEDYATIASDLAGRPDLLSPLRQEMRTRLQASPLCDIDGFARDLAAVLTEVWHQTPW